MSSSYSSSRTVQYQAYGSAGGAVLRNDLVSGMSSAGAICTTQIRDAREREKREIGLLNDRLADYIEKVRFLKAQNHVLAHDIEILKRGFSGGGSIHGFFDTEISQCTHKTQTILANRTQYQTDVTALTGEIEVWRTKWLQAISAVKAHREDHDVNLDKLAEIEAQIALFHRKIRIVEEDVHRIRRENGNIQGTIGRIHSQIHAEISAKNEFTANIQSLLHRVKTITTENTSRIEQELVYIRRDTTIENRDYFRHELQAAMRDIRANYEAVSLRSRQDIEVWYHRQIENIRANSGTQVYHVDINKEEIVQIRSTLSHVQSRLAEIECRNTLLVGTITDLKHQQTEEARIFEAILAEKDAQNAKLRERCTEISIQMEKLCDHEVSLHTELERYRTLLNGANVTTYVANSSGAGLRTSHVTQTTTRTTGGYSASSATYGHTAGHSSSHRGITVGGNIGGISVGGHIDGGHVSGGANGYHQASYSYSSSASNR